MNITIHSIGPFPPTAKPQSIESHPRLKPVQIDEFTNYECASKIYKRSDRKGGFGVSESRPVFKLLSAVYVCRSSLCTSRRVLTKFHLGLTRGKKRSLIRGLVYV